MTDNFACDKVKQVFKLIENAARLFSRNSVTKRVRIEDDYRESPFGARRRRRICGRWLPRGVGEGQKMLLADDRSACYSGNEVCGAGDALAADEQKWYHGAARLLTVSRRQGGFLSNKEGDRI